MVLVQITLHVTLHVARGEDEFDMTRGWLAMWQNQKPEHKATKVLSPHSQGNIAKSWNAWPGDRGRRWIRWRGGGGEV